jgi:hypothetical protein
MPIRLNLLAEAQAAEELRRRDPVKRFVWIGVLAVALMLAWSSFLQLRVMRAHSELSQVENLMNSRTNEFQKIVGDQKKATEIKGKIEALRQLADGRLLNGSLLNALQQTSVEDVQLVRLRIEQSYRSIEAGKSRTNADNVVVKGKPASTTERTVVTVEGTDSSANPGDQVTKCKEAMAANPYLKELFVKTNSVSLKSLAPPQIGPSGKPSVGFTLECRLLEKTR